MIENTVIVNICNQRTGSKFLGSCLRAGADIVPLGELFNPDYGQALTYWSWLAENGKHGFRNGVSFELLDAFFDALYTQFGPVCFDLMYNQLSAISPPWQDEFGVFIIKYFMDRRFHVIHTERNPVDIYLSLLNLSHSGVAHKLSSARDDSQYATIKIKVSLDDYVRFEKNYIKWKVLVGEQLKEYPRLFNLDFSNLVSNNGFLPSDAMIFLSNAVRCSGGMYGDHVQVRKAVFGLAPKSKIEISNLEELLIFVQENANGDSLLGD